MDVMEGADIVTEVTGVVFRRRNRPSPKTMAL